MMSVSEHERKLAERGAVHHSADGIEDPRRADQKQIFLIQWDDSHHLCVSRVVAKGGIELSVCYEPPQFIAQPFAKQQFRTARRLLHLRRRSTIRARPG